MKRQYKLIQAGGFNIQRVSNKAWLNNRKDRKGPWFRFWRDGQDGVAHYTTIAWYINSVAFDALKARYVCFSR